MASRGIEIPLSLNPAKVIRGLKVTQDEFEDLADKVEDLGKTGDKTADKLDDLGDEGRRSMDRLSDEVDDTERAFRDFGRGADLSMDKVRRAADRTEDSIGDIEDEANQSAKEFGASFRGDPVEALEEVQSYLSEIVAVKLPGFAGAAATIAGGAVLGLVVAGVEQWREKQERIQELATDYLNTIKGLSEGPLNSWSQYYDDLIDKQLALNVLEEASAAQTRDLALLAQGRGVTLEEYVRLLQTGELATQEELARITAERNRIADELLTITNDNNAANDDQIPILQAQDAALQGQAEALREQGGWINENVAAARLAKGAQEQVAKATQDSYEKQRFVNRAAIDTRDSLIQVEGKAKDIDKAIKDIPNLSRKTIEVTDGGSIARFNAAMYAAVRPAYKTIFVTEVRRDAAAASRGSNQPGNERP